MSEDKERRVVMRGIEGSIRKQQGEGDRVRGEKPDRAKLSPRRTGLGFRVRVRVRVGLG